MGEMEGDRPTVRRGKTREIQIAGARSSMVRPNDKHTVRRRIPGAVPSMTASLMRNRDSGQE